MHKRSVYNVSYCIKNHNREFPGGPVVRTRAFTAVALGSIPGWGTRILKKKKKKNHNKSLNPPSSFRNRINTNTYQGPTAASIYLFIFKFYFIFIFRVLFLKFIYLYLFIFGCVGSSLLHAGFL